MGGAGRRLWCGGGGYRRETSCSGGDRVDRVMGSVSELGRKNSPEKFSGGGWPEKMAAAVAGGWPDPTGARRKKWRGRRVFICCMTRSSTKELFTPFKDPEQEFRSSRKHFKTLKTMEQYMSKTRADYGSGVARPKIEDKDNFELKGQFLKELRTNNFSGSDHEDVNEHIEKFLEIMDLFHIPNITIDQEDLKTKFLSKYFPPARTAKKMEEINNFQHIASEWFKELLMKCPQHYLTEMQEVVLFYNRLDVPTRQILDSRGAIPSKTTTDAK
ncbi:hypothetical protein Tco_1486473, partial [Tanacetum coccineum]